jgi:dUTP pyrophosphatase
MEQEEIVLKIKKLNPNAVIPSYSKPGDAGLDLTVISSSYENDRVITYHFGIAVEIPEGYVGLLFPRSSICSKTMTLSNSVGVIDSGYRGEIMAKFRMLNSEEVNLYNPGERAVQLILQKIPSVTIVETDELSETDRGIGGYGSTGK